MPKPKLPKSITEHHARSACEWHERCIADESMRYRVSSIEQAIALKLSCSAQEAFEVARWWNAQKATPATGKDGA